MERRTRWQGTAPDAAARLGLSLRVFWRWVAAGEATGDLLPVDTPAAVPEWYERHRERGDFSHRLPERVRLACSTLGQPNHPATPENSGSGAGGAEGAGVSDFDHGGHGGQGADVVEVTPGGLVEEVAKLEEDVSAFRAMRDAEKDPAERRRLDGVYQEKLNLLMRLKKDLPRFLESSDEFLRKRLFEREHAGVVGVMVQTLDARLRSARLHSIIKSSLAADEFSRVMGEEIRAVIKMLAESRFAPPLELVAA